MTTLYRKIVDAIVSENKEQAAHQFGVAMAHAVKEQLEDFKAAVGQKIFESVGETNNTFIPVKQDFTIEAIDPAKKNDRMPDGEPVRYKVNAWGAAKAYKDAASKGHTNIKVTDHAGNDVTSQAGLKEDVAEGFVDPSTYHRELGKYGPEVVANTYKDKFGTENVEHTVDGRNIGTITKDPYGRKIHFLHGYSASWKNASSLDESMKLVSKHGDGQHTAKVYKDSDWGEYRVKFFKDGKHVGEDGDYHTDDLDDAKSTADSQIKRYQMNEALDNGPGKDLSDRLIEGIDIDAQFSKWKNDLAAQHPKHIKSGKVKFLSHPDAPNTVSAEVGDRTLGIFNHKTGETQVFTESVTPASVVKSHIENLLADKDINATVTDSSVKVHKSNVQRTKKLLDRHGYSHKVESGLNEDTATALAASKEAAREAAEEQSKAKAPTIQDVVSVLGNTVSVADIGAAQ